MLIGYYEIQFTHLKSRTLKEGQDEKKEVEREQVFAREGRLLE
jgi:hypothetical protein